MIQVQPFRTVLLAEQLKPVVKLPEDFAGKILEVTIRPVPKRIFRSLPLIHIDTTTFRFNRDEANER